MKMIKTADETAVIEAAQRIQDGALVAFPTETVYGLGSDATNARAVAAIFAAKGRPSFNPLIIHVSGREAAAEHAIVTGTAQILMAAFWPGPLTLVLRKRPESAIAQLALAGLDTIALRCPSHPVARALLAQCGLPVAAPSANKSGRVSPTTAHHVAHDFSSEDILILDGGPVSLGLESTIIDATIEPPILLRPGTITRSDIAAILGSTPVLRTAAKGENPSAPGQLASHYAPAAAVRLNATGTVSGEALLAFGLPVPDHDGPMLNLSESGNLLEAAANLFAHLRALDRSDVSTIAVMPIPDVGLGEAINDRLRRASAPRS